MQYLVFVTQFTYVLRNTQFKHKHKHARLKSASVRPLFALNSSLVPVFAAASRPPLPHRV
eukprot:scaffold23157_cov103-Isochrysis_galbana.AAC.2